MKTKSKKNERIGEKQFFFYGKKAAEINQQMVIFILAVIFIIVLMIFSTRACDLIKERNREVILNDLSGNIKNVVEFLSPKQGTIKEFTFDLPEGIDTVCFVDLSKKEIILKDTLLVKEYPIINSTLTMNDTKNIFLIQNRNVVDTLYGGNICFDYYPFYSCTATPDNLLDIWFEGRADCTTLYINWSAFPVNHKNSSLYSGNPLFLIEEKRPKLETDINNWREILSIIPLTLFRENGTTYQYNYSILYKPAEQGLLNITNIESLEKLYSSTNVYLFDTQITGNNIDLKSSKDDYLSFWEDYSSLILVDSNNKFSGLIASLLAAYVNTPLIFINDSNLDDYKDVIREKQVFVIAHGSKILDKDTSHYVQNYASRYNIIQDTLLGSEGTVPAFAKIHSKIELR